MSKPISEYTEKEWEALSDIDKAIAWAGVYRDLCRARSEAYPRTSSGREARKSLEEAIRHANEARKEYLEKAKGQA